MSNIFQKVGNCKVEAKFDASSPLSYGNVREAVPAIGKAVKQEFKDTIAASDANQEFKDAIAAEPVAKKKKCKKRSPYKKKSRLEGESDLDYNRRVHGVNRGSRPSNYQGPVTEQVGETVKGSVQKLV